MIVNKLEWQKILALSVLMLALEIWSYLAFSLPSFSAIIFIFLVLIFLVIAVYNLKYALFGVFSELIIGSMGHLFFLELSDFRLSIRMTFWLIIILVFSFNFLFNFFKYKQESEYFKRIKNFGFLKIFGIFSLLILFGLLKGFLNGNSLGVIFGDFNSWLFFLLLFPFLALADFKNKDFVSDLKVMLLASVFWLSFKTLFLLTIFSHNLSIASEAYYWLRKTLVGEMTAGTWPRIFIQSQIFSGAAFFTFFSFANFFKNSQKFFTKNNIFLIFSSALTFSSIILSFSRSFWLAFVLTLFLSLILIWRFLGFNKVLKTSVWLFSSFILSFILIYFITILPFSEVKGTSLNKGLSERLSQDSSEPALASRWSLLPALWLEIKEAPILGKGFGSEITYISSDPRVLERNPSGEYKTSAFEWGYLDIWLKIGLLGLLIYLLLIFEIILSAFKKAFSKLENRLEAGLYFGVALSLIFLAIVHVFTPYLNHPLGIGLLILSACIIYENKVYLITKNRLKIN